MIPRICYRCGKALTGDFVHLEEGTSIYATAKGSIDICLSCLDLDDFKYCYECGNVLETDESDMVIDGDDDHYCEKCARELKDAGDWIDEDEEDDSDEDCGGRRCDDCLLDDCVHN